MITHNAVCVYCSGPTCPDIDRIKTIFTSYLGAIDFHVYVDNNQLICDTETPTIGGEHMRFYNGHMVFCNTQDFLSNRDKLMAQPYLCIDKSDPLLKIVDRAMLKNCKLLVRTNETLEIIEHHAIL